MTGSGSDKGLKTKLFDVSIMSQRAGMSLSRVRLWSIA
jgi:hypothetical protein